MDFDIFARLPFEVVQEILTKGVLDPVDLYHVSRVCRSTFLARALADRHIMWTGWLKYHIRMERTRRARLRLAHAR